MYVLKCYFFEASSLNAVLPLKIVPDSNSKRQQNVPSLNKNREYELFLSAVIYFF